MKILTTGGNGLIGSCIKTDVLIRREFDLINPYDVKKMFETHKPTHVIHCAAKVGGLGSNMKYKGDFFFENIMINTNMVEIARQNNVEKFVGFLSTCVFPENIEYPISEKKIHMGPPHHSNYPYAYSKRMLDIQLKSYREQYGLNYVSVIPTNIYGPNDNFSIENGHVLPSLIHKLYLAIKNKTDFVVWGTGNPKREFIFSEDVAFLTKWVLENYNEEDPLILSTSTEISIKDIVDILVQEFNYKGKIIFDNSKPDGQLRKPSDNSKLKSYLPEFNFTDVEVGLKKTIKWFMENYENARK